VKGKLLKFADDTKLVNSVDNAEDNSVQTDLDNLKNWADKMLMSFNVQKSGTIHFGFNNAHKKYKLGDYELKDFVEEKDLGVMIDSSLTFSGHCAYVVKQANSLVGLINRSFTCKNQEILMALYKFLIRPKLEYCVQAWRPYLIKDINLLEGVQRRVTRMIVKNNSLSYEERLNLLGLTSLEMRRERGDMIEVFKILKGLVKVKQDRFFQLRNDYRLKGHSLILKKQYSRLNVRKNSFALRVVTPWNKLPEKVVQSVSVLDFKNYDLYIRTKGIS
jgi:hypothetical protein